MNIKPSDTVQETHLKSALDVALENAQKALTSMRDKLKDEPQNLAKRERAFMIRECSKLENMSNLQMKLDQYREQHSRMKLAERVKEAQNAGNSEKLGLHLRAAGAFRLNKHWHAHHIVCSRHPSHAAARFKLFAYLRINDPYNGCWLPTKHKYATGTIMPNAVGHSYLHTDKYADWVRRDIVSASGKSDLISKLQGIRLKLQDARNLPDILTDKGQTDLRTVS